MTPSFPSLMTDFANEIGVNAEQLARTQELIVDAHTIGFYLDIGEGPTGGDEAESQAVSEAVMQTASVVLFTLLGEVDHEQLPRISRTLLEANSLWAGTSGCTLGLQRNSNQVILCIQLPLPTLTGAGLVMIVNGFCETANFWKSFVLGMSEEADDEVQPSMMDRA